MTWSCLVGQCPWMRRCAQKSVRYTSGTAPYTGTPTVASTESTSGANRCCPRCDPRNRSSRDFTSGEVTLSSPATGPLSVASKPRASRFELARVSCRIEVRAA